MIYSPKSQIKVRPHYPKEHLTLGDLASGIQKKMDFELANHDYKREKGMCILLTHTISMAASHLARKYQHDQNESEIKKKWPLTLSGPTGCPVEDSISSHMTRDGLDEIPPFFPGDRTGLI